MHVENLLDENTGSFTSAASAGVGSWVGTNVELTRTSRRYLTQPASMRVTFTGSNGGTSLIYSGEDSTLISVVPGTDYRAFGWIHHQTPGREFRFGVQMYDNSGASIPLTNAVTGDEYFVDKTMGYSEWTLASLRFTAPVEAVSAAIFIQFESVDTSTDDKYFWLDSCVFVEYAVPTDEELIQRLMRWIPEYILLQDERQSNPEYPLLSFLDVADADLHTILEYITSFGYYDVGDPTKPDATSNLVDPRGFPENGTLAEWLWWLASITGTNRRGIVGGISTSSLWSDLDGLTWSQWEDSLNIAPLGSAITISTSSRTSGVATVTASSNHGLEVGDSISVTNAGNTTFSGYYAVASVTSPTVFTYSQTYFINQIVQSGTTTVTVTTARAHGLSNGNSVVISGTGIASFDGTKTVASTPTTTSFTFTAGSSATQTSYFGYVYPANTASPVSGGSFQPVSDLSWTFVEGSSLYPLSVDEALAQFIATGASGIWAGTIEGIKRAARISLIGFDVPALIERFDGVVTVTIKEPHNLSVSDDFVIYGSPVININGSYQVDSIVDDYIFTAVSGGENVNTRGSATDKIVNIDKQNWNGLINTVQISSGVVTITFVDPVPVLLVGNNITISGTGNSSLNGTTTTAGITVSNDRYTITYNTALSNFGPESPAGAKALLDTGCYYCFVVKTLPSQTKGPEIVIQFANFARPAGGIITHDFIS